MRWLKAVIAGWFLLLSGAAFSFEFNSSYYGVYEGPVMSGCPYGCLYIVPKSSLLIIASDVPTPIIFMPQTTGFRAAFLNDGSLSAFEKVELNAGNLPLGAVPSSYILFGADFDGDGKPDFFLQGNNTVRNSLILVADGTGTPQIYSNFYGALNSAQYPHIAIVDADRDGWIDIVATDIYGNVNPFLNVPGSGFGGGAGTGTGGNTLIPSLVGSIDGKFQVDETGAATYKVDILAAPGTAGVVPHISLNYSSTTGNGVAGVGWSVGGLSAITRCRQTLVQDNNATPITLGPDDRYCLDGQRLILTSGIYGNNGSTYRTEIDSYAVVTVTAAFNGYPAYFTVRRKDGSLSYYGDGTPQGANNSSPALNTGGAAPTWAISRFEDGAGNAIRFRYTNNASMNEQLLTRIDYAYGSNPGNTADSSTYIELNYQTRLDVSNSYVGGAKISRTQRLTSIRSVSNGAELRSYNLVYREFDWVHLQSFVEKLYECVGSNCLSPTTFNWKLNQGGFGAGTQIATVGGSDRASVRPMDINGDGRMDLIFIGLSSRHLDPNNNQSLLVTDYTLSYRLSAGSGFGAEIALPSGTFNNGTNAPSEVSPILIVDYNNDGRQDLIAGSQVFLGTASGFAAGATITSMPSPLQNPTPSDFTGDGLADIAGSSFLQLTLYPSIRTNAGGLWSIQYGSQQFATVSGYSPPPIDPPCLRGTVVLPELLGTAADVDGDGRADFPAINKYQGCGGSGLGTTPAYSGFLLSKGGLNFSTSAWVLGRPTAPFDMNNDGLADMWADDESPGTNRSLRFSTGTGFTAPVVAGSATTLKDAQYIDYNGDGYPDILYPSGNYLAVKIFNWTNQTFVTEFNANAAGGTIPYSANTSTYKADKFVYSDFDGDGHTDVVRINYIGAGNNAIWMYRSADVGSAGNRIIGIDNGLGLNTTVTYKPLSDPAVYTKASDANNVTSWPNEPVFDVITPMYVVSNVSSTAPMAHAMTPGAVNYSATSSVSYRYGGLKVQASGRGSLGFAAITSIDDQTQIKTSTLYRQDFPFVGQPFWTTVSSGTGVISKSMVNTTDRTVRNGLNGTKYYQVYSTQLVDQTNDPISGVETGYRVNQNSVPDEWGNVGSTTISAYPASAHSTYLTQKSITNTYGSTTDDKKFGRLSGSVVVHKRVDQPNITRTTAFTYYPAGNSLNGLLWTERVSAADGAPTKTTTYEYDSFGNKTKVTESAAGQTSRYATTTYDAGRFVSSRSSEFYNGSTWVPQVTEAIVSRNNYGMPTQVTGLNGLVTNYRYDALGREVERNDNTGAALYTYFIRGGMTGAQLQVKTVAATGAMSAEYFDVLGRSISKGKVGFDGRWIYSETEYDNVGRVKRQSAPHYGSDYVYWATNNYDAFRLQSQTVPSSNGSYGSTTYEYGVYSAPFTKITNAANQTRIELRNYAAEVTSVTDYLGGVVSYTYDATGQVTQTTNTGTQNGGAITINTVLTYDQLGRKIKLIDSDKGTWFYQYNGFGELTDQYKVMSTGNYSGTLATAIAATVPMQHTQMVYDRRGRMTERSDYLTGGVLERTAKWEYDTADNGVGQLATDYIDDQMIGHYYAYDQFGRPSAQIVAVDAWYGEETSYDGYGRVATQIDAVGSGSGTRNNYNAYGYLQSISDLATNTVLYQVQNMDASGKVTTAVIGNGATTTWNYDAGSGLLLNQTAVLGATVLQNLTYTWDVLGNQTSRWDHGLLAPSSTKNIQQSFCYDGLNRLLKTNQGALSGSCSLTAAQQDQEYDSFGSITRKTGVGTYTYNNGRLHQLQSTSDGVSYTYDTVGNMTSDSSGRTLTYTVFDKPASISKSANQIAFTYGVDREMVKRVDTTSSDTSTTYHLGDVEKVVKADGSYDMKRYIAGVAIWTHHFDSSDVQTGVDQQYVYKDVLGSVVMITNQLGVSKQQFAYDPWGRRVWANNGTLVTQPAASLPVAAQLTTEGFTGHDMLDAMGLIHMGGRIYDQKLGRFVQADPVVQAPDFLQSFNRYAYVFNAPLQYTDPTGYEVGVSDQTPYFRNFGSIDSVISCGGGCAGYSPPLMLPVGFMTGGVSLGSYSLSLSFASNSAFSAVSPNAISNAAGLEGPAQSGSKAQKGEKSPMDNGRASRSGKDSASQSFAENEDPEEVTVECCTKPDPSGDSGPSFSMDQYKAQEWEEFKDLYWTVNQYNPVVGFELQAAKAWGVIAFGILKRAPVAGKITGYTKHGLNQAISREGVGASAKAMLDAVKNPLRTVQQAKGAIKYVGTDATVVLNQEGKVITTYARGSGGIRAGGGGK